jgi:hypothetical protein
MVGYITNLKNTRIDRVLDEFRAALMTSTEALQELINIGVNELAAEQLIDDILEDPA